MKGKPIEPGCLAIIIGATVAYENNGRVVRVLRRAGVLESPPEALAKAHQMGLRIVAPPGYDHNAARWWVEPVNGTLRWQAKHFAVDCAARSYQERFLRRIDDGENYSHETNETMSNPIGETA